MPFHYATLLSIVEYDDSTEVTIKDPWNCERTLHRYVLQEKQVERGFAAAAVFTSSHAQLLTWLNAADRIAAVCDLKYMNIPEIRRRVADRHIIDCGDSRMPDIEQLTMAGTDAILLSPFENSGGYGMLETMGIPIIECADYMEPTPLARAEWMKLYGLLFGCKEQADSLFREVERSYLQQAAAARRMNTRSTLLTERKTGSTWYVPGGKSWMGQLIKDAAARHPFPDDTHSGSLPLSPEQVIARGEEIDVWAVKNSSSQPLTQKSLLAEYDGYKMLKAMREGRVYECNTMEKPFFEQTAFRPDWLLSDYIAIAHPEECRDSVLRYYRRIE